jgi:hypothetical protein
MTNTEPTENGLKDTEHPLLIVDMITNAVVYDQRIIGEIDLETMTLTLNAGWCRLAGLGLVVQGDPASDRKRVVFERTVTDHHLASGS